MNELTPGVWLRILTKATLTDKDIALIEGCSLKTAQRRVMSITNHRNGMPYVCRTDAYLKAYRGTDRKTEIQNIYGDVK